MRVNFHIFILPNSCGFCLQYKLVQLHQLKPPDGVFHTYYRRVSVFLENNIKWLIHLHRWDLLIRNTLSRTAKVEGGGVWRTDIEWGCKALTRQQELSPSSGWPILVHFDTGVVGKKGMWKLYVKFQHPREPKSVTLKMEAKFFFETPEELSNTWRRNPKYEHEVL
jgi:hypothetical protein